MPALTVIDDEANEDVAATAWKRQRAQVIAVDAANGRKERVVTDLRDYRIFINNKKVDHDRAQVLDGPHRLTAYYILEAIWRRAWRLAQFVLERMADAPEYCAICLLASARMVEFGTISMSQWRQVLGRAPTVSSFIHESSHSTFAVSCPTLLSKAKSFRKIAKKYSFGCAPRGGGKEIDGVDELEVEVLPELCSVQFYIFIVHDAVETQAREAVELLRWARHELGKEGPWISERSTRRKA